MSTVQITDKAIDTFHKLCSEESFRYMDDIVSELSASEKVDLVNVTLQHKQALKTYHEDYDTFMFLCDLILNATKL